jgi:hypothetical protein
MAAPLIVSNFMATLASKAREIAVPELFGGDSDQAIYRLALDYTIPIIKDDGDKDYDVQLVARISHKDGDTYETIVAPIGAKYNFKHINPGPANWGIPTESLAYQLVANMRTYIQKLYLPRFLQIIQGDTAACGPHMRRIWIK